MRPATSSADLGEIKVCVVPRLGRAPDQGITTSAFTRWPATSACGILARVDLYDEFERLIEALDRAEVEYAVCGGVAVVLYGHVRATRDIDLLVRSDGVGPAKEAVRTVGFSLPALPMRFDTGTPAEREVQRVSKIVGQDLLTLDLIILGPALSSVWETREVLEWKHRRLWVVSRQGLARMKRVAGRKQDLADLERLGIEDE